LSSVFDWVVWGVVALLLIPVALNPAGWLAGLLLVGAWLVVTYGGREYLELEKSRRQGERAKALEVRNWGDRK
jgi:amino acid permease